jgi:hypothetical protein
MGMLSKVHGWGNNPRDHPSISGGSGGTLEGTLKNEPPRRQDRQGKNKKKREKNG